MTKSGSIDENVVIWWTNLPLIKMDLNQHNKTRINDKFDIQQFQYYWRLIYRSLWIKWILQNLYHVYEAQFVKTLSLYRKWMQYDWYGIKVTYQINFHKMLDLDISNHLMTNQKHLNWHHEPCRFSLFYHL